MAAQVAAQAVQMLLVLVEAEEQVVSAQML
jgi:hypothetical protein